MSDPQIEELLNTFTEKVESDQIPDFAKPAGFAIIGLLATYNFATTVATIASDAGGGEVEINEPVQEFLARIIRTFPTKKSLLEAIELISINGGFLPPNPVEDLQ